MNDCDPSLESYVLLVLAGSERGVYKPSTMAINLFLLYHLWVVALTI